ncbi:Uncharacterised protein [Dermatophilus congolensis]|uniref:Uncharacterized protein n=11 Tax=Dermatophilus congolensis TaxID=1863 RepID=A0A239V8X3_9MICO|nr:hypothetical protein [Dermatophilus congolensis]SNV17983.1 Uncharacterised protein [Dermatophilus congolensis]
MREFGSGLGWGCRRDVGLPLVGCVVLGVSVGGVSWERVVLVSSEVVARRSSVVRLPSVRGMRVVSEGVYGVALESVISSLVSGPRVAGRAGRVGVTAWLVALEGRGGVVVEVDGVVVGELPPGQAPLWRGTLLRAQQEGVRVSCEGVVTFGEGPGFVPVLSLRVVEPEHLRLMLGVPEGVEPLVPECVVTVPARSMSADAVARVAREVVEWVTLHPTTLSCSRHVGEPGVEVRVAGERVGEFSSLSSARYRPVVDALVQVEKTPLARARLRDGTGELEVLLPRVGG